MSVEDAKAEIDTLIGNSRFRCYRPLRVAEILFRSRTDAEIDIADPESYRVASARWRDEISERLTGKGSTSSRSYQKDFSDLLSPEDLGVLDRVNRENDGLVECYIYSKLRHDKWGGLIAAQEYVESADVDTFTFAEYMALTDESGLQEDSMLEIAVYALFTALTEELDAEAVLELGNPDRAVTTDFSDFVGVFLGLAPDETSFRTPVDIHRAGQGTYAADKGVDIGTNFGTMVQVKHVSLDTAQAEKIDENSHVDRVVVVCRDAERDVIESVSDQLGFDRVQDIVTISDLEAWYDRAIDDHRDSIGRRLLAALRDEFSEEFQRGEWKVPEIDALLDERGYDPDRLTGRWAL